MAETFNFDADAVGKVPAGWIAGVTGQGAHRWSVETDESAPSKPNVLRQSGRGDFPWCVRRDSAIADGHVEVRFKPLAGNEGRQLLVGPPLPGALWRRGVALLRGPGQPRRAIAGGDRSR